MDCYTDNSSILQTRMTQVLFLPTVSTGCPGWGLLHILAGLPNYVSRSSQLLVLQLSTCHSRFPSYAFPLPQFFSLQFFIFHPLPSTFPFPSPFLINFLIQLSNSTFILLLSFSFFHSPSFILLLSFSFFHSPSFILPVVLSISSSPILPRL
jgi:hypothetical protein